MMGTHCQPGFGAAHASVFGAALGAKRRSRDVHYGESAFTLLELMMVITIVLILATFAIPMYQTSIVRAKEAVLKNDLFTMRKLIDQYTLDKKQPPSSLDDLVTAGYLHAIPVDPFTESNQTWQADIEEVNVGGDTPVSGVVDVHSGSSSTSLQGTPYNTW